MRDEDIVRSSK